MGPRVHAPVRTCALFPCVPSLDACAIVSVSVLKFRAPQGTLAPPSAEPRSAAARGQDARGYVSRIRANRPKGLLLALAVARLALEIWRRSLAEACATPAPAPWT